MTYTWVCVDYVDDQMPDDKNNRHVVFTLYSCEENQSIRTYTHHLTSDESPHPVV